jgi:hypothetical protein
LFISLERKACVSHKKVVPLGWLRVGNLINY